MTWNKVIIALGWLIIGSAPIAQGNAEITRLESVKKLIEESTAARHVENGNNAEAKKKHKEARELYQRAVAAAKAGNAEESNKLLNQASNMMFSAVRLLGPSVEIVEKRRKDYESRLESVNALVAAYDRISEEKSVGASAREQLHQLVRTKVQQGETFQEAGNFKAGRKVLDEAYVAIKVAVEQLRGGDTLVRSLNFKSEKEEYEYEVDRNDTHKMLVNVLLREKMSGNPRIKSQVEKFMDKATSMRENAEKHAAKGNYEAAIKALEESTKEIVRAIRTAGIFIPG